MTIGVFLSVFVQRAEAGAAPWMFTMALRAVDGEKNKAIHVLDAGALTLDGSIWVTNKLARATPEPQPVSKREAIDKTGDGWHLQGAGTLVTK